MAAISPSAALDNGLHTAVRIAWTGFYAGLYSWSLYTRNYLLISADGCLQLDIGSTTCTVLGRLGRSKGFLISYQFIWFRICQLYAFQYGVTIPCFGFPMSVVSTRVHRRHRFNIHFMTCWAQYFVVRCSVVLLEMNRPTLHMTRDTCSKFVCLD